eukprot:725592-Rhodomonas_salina.2
MAWMRACFWACGIDVSRRMFAISRFRHESSSECAAAPLTSGEETTCKPAGGSGMSVNPSSSLPVVVLASGRLLRKRAVGRGVSSLRTWCEGRGGGVTWRRSARTFVAVCQRDQFRVDHDVGQRRAVPVLFQPLLNRPPLVHLSVSRSHRVLDDVKSQWTFSPIFLPSLAWRSISDF